MQSTGVSGAASHRPTSSVLLRPRTGPASELRTLRRVAARAGRRLLERPATADRRGPVHSVRGGRAFATRVGGTGVERLGRGHGQTVLFQFSPAMTAVARNGSGPATFLVARNEFAARRFRGRARRIPLRRRPVGLRRAVAPTSVFDLVDDGASSRPTTSCWPRSASELGEAGFSVEVDVMRNRGRRDRADGDRGRGLFGPDVPATAHPWPPRPWRLIVLALGTVVRAETETRRSARPKTPVNWRPGFPRTRDQSMSLVSVGAGEQRSRVNAKT